MSILPATVAVAGFATTVPAADLTVCVSFSIFREERW